MLVDAPCSATGVIRRHPDIKLLRRPADIAAFAATQRHILATAFELLRPGGRLIYCTCSVLPEENEAGGLGLPEPQPARRRGRLDRRSAAAAGPAGAAVGWQLLPGGDAGTDGFYYACLQSHRRDHETTNAFAPRVAYAPERCCSRLLLVALGSASRCAPTRSTACSKCARPTSASDQGVFQLFARVAYPVNDDIRAALKDGLTLTFDLDVVVSRERRFWMDETVASYTLQARAHLSRGQRPLRHARRRSHVNSSEQHSYATLEEALEALGTVDAWPFLLSPQLSASRQYRVSACAPACAAGACPTPCACCCSGPTTGTARASGSHGPCSAETLGTLGLIALWVLVSGGLLLLLALSVQNSVQYSNLQAWILLVNAIAVVTVSVLLARKIIELVRAFRAQVPGFAPDGAHRGDLRLAGDRAADHRLSILASSS